MPVNYYEVLQVEKDANSDEIRKSYRLLVRKHHPDSGNKERDPAMFHRVQEAWEALSDPEKRKEYDKSIGSTDWDSVRENKLKEFKAKGPAKASSWSYPKHGGDTQNTEFGVSREKSFIDRLKSVASAAQEGNSFTEKIRLASKNITSKDGSAIDERDTIVNKRRFQVSIDALESLTGASREVVVMTVNGERRVTVDIPAGIHSGSILAPSLPKTDEFPAQKISVRVDISSHEFVEREGLNVVLKIPITVGEALKGTEIEVPSLSGKATLRIAPGHGVGKKLRIKGKGVSSGSEIGDMYIIPYITLPEIGSEDAERLGLAAQVVDELYVGDIRSNVPDTLT